MDLIRSRIKVKSLNFMRGRTFINKFLIIDEAQNLTLQTDEDADHPRWPRHQGGLPRQHRADRRLSHRELVRSLIYVVGPLQGWDHSGHITLQQGERSRLADHASGVL